MSDYKPATLVGLAIGDALGMPFETLGTAVHPLLGSWDGTMIPGTHHDLPAGHYTDDAEMAIALTKSMIVPNNIGFKGASAAEHYLRWFRGKPTGMGGSVRAAMAFLDHYGVASWQSSGKGVADQFPEEVGSGTVMRCAPIGVYYATDPNMIRRACKEDAYITHAHKEAYAASLAVSTVIAGIIREREVHGNDGSDTDIRDEVLSFMDDQMIVVRGTLTETALEYCIDNYQDMERSTDYVVDTVLGRFGSAWQIAVSGIWCAMKNWGDFGAGVQEAIRLGGDTDTRGAVTGAILGTIVGLDGIPSHYKESLKDFEMIAGLDAALYQNV